MVKNNYWREGWPSLNKNPEDASRYLSGGEDLLILPERTLFAERGGKDSRKKKGR